MCWGMGLGLERLKGSAGDSNVQPTWRASMLKLLGLGHFRSPASISSQVVPFSHPRTHASLIYVQTAR